MCKLTSISKDALVFELEPILSSWQPSVGEAFYAPDILSLGVPVVKFIWHGGDSDRNLMSMSMVFKTPEEALDQYRFLKGFIYFATPRIE